MALNTDFPCTTGKCLSFHEQLALLVFLIVGFMAQGDTVDSLVEDTKDLRNLSPNQLLQNVLAGFGTDLIATATPEALACYNCLSTQKLLEILSLQVASLVAPVP